MHLLNLPPEIMDQIFENIGPRFFQTDLRRLSLSKRWHVHAKRVITQGLWFSSAMLESFLRGRDEYEVVAHRIGTLQQLQLYLHGLYPEETDDFQKACQSLQREQGLWHTAPWMAWREDARQQLLAFCQMVVSQCPQLKTFQIFAQQELEPNPHFSGVGIEYLGIGAINILLQGLSSLTFLELDLNGSDFICAEHPINGGERRSQTDSQQVHLCTTIGSLLRHLVRLRVRYSPICPAVVGYPNAIINPKLKEISINLSLQRHSSTEIQSRSGAIGCFDATKRESAIRNILIGHMQRLKETLEAPEHLRILYHNDHREPDAVYQLRAYDAVNTHKGFIFKPAVSEWYTPQEPPGAQMRTQSHESVTDLDAFAIDNYVQEDATQFG